MEILLLTTAMLFAGPLPVVAIDPGHGGEQLGAIGVCGTFEKNITLSVAMELAGILEASSRARPFLTRTKDQTVDLETRFALANHAKAEMYVSIHANASTKPDSHGIETYFLSRRASDKRILQLALKENEGAMPEVFSKPNDSLGAVLDGLLLNASHAASQRLALRVHTTLSTHLHTHSRGVLQAPFIVLLGAKMPAALVEIGFLTNPKECRRLSDKTHQHRIARILAAGILEHLEAESAQGLAWR